ncbi:MAG: FAD-dependent oxidoreductase [Candidatus Poseidoniaceae archaeon]|nr:FAD-dependent oxidoreductase [Candidatus Poseidoniaceae archaeon]MBL6895539.1 FAD-dependent oxidoreductase [Candidatus Poseidoniaceae archaeon]
MSDIAIIGSGIAGLFSALKLANAGHDVTVITKRRLKDSSTNWAQGGIAGILDKTDIGAKESHIQDTLASGDGLCNESMVREVIEGAAECIFELVNIGVQFEKNQQGDFKLAKEGGHTERRILHAKDATGREIERALSEAAKNHNNITLMRNTLAIDLVQRDYRNPEEGVCGVWCLDQKSTEVITVKADSVIIATGGVGQLWSKTTNPGVATGDGVAMAYRCGAAVKDMAFIQFHPTALTVKNDRPYLITEALRGEGGVILDKQGLAKWEDDCQTAIKLGQEAPAPNNYSFTLEFSSLGSMATRDIVARAIDNNLKKTGEKNVYLVTSHLEKSMLKESFPNMQTHLDKYNLTLGYDHLPISPAAHYIVGGLDVDRFGRPKLRNKQSPMPYLYAIGEVACTGMHGANRLASNSLLEAVVFAKNTANHIIENSPKGTEKALPDWRADGLNELKEHAPIINDLTMLKDTMSTEVGIVRNFKRLNRAARRLHLLNREIDMIWKSALPSREIIELRNLIQVAILVTDDANDRKENRGLHYNTELV